MNSHGTAIACRAGPAPQGQPVQVKNCLFIMDLRFVDQGRISQERLHVSGTVLLQKIDGKPAGITVRNGAALPGNIHIIPIIGKSPRIGSGGKTESRRLRIVGARAQGKTGPLPRWRSETSITRE